MAHHSSNMAAVCSVSPDFRFNDSCDVTVGIDVKNGGGGGGAAEPADGEIHPAFYVFVIAQLLGGIGSSGIHTMSLAYIDENAPKSKSSLYVGENFKSSAHRWSNRSTDARLSVSTLQPIRINYLPKARKQKDQ